MTKQNAENGETKRTCNQCDKTLHGRADQRFCNDTCRNNFNRAKRQRERIRDHENVPEIFRIIKRNYEILRSQNTYLLTGNESISVPKKSLIQAGFNPKFYTSTWHDGNTEWKFCFERGWDMGETVFFIIDRLEQAEV